MKRLFKLSVAIVCFLFDVVCSGMRRLFQIPKRVCLVVLYYHSVAEGLRAAFLRQLDTLLRVCKPWPAAWDGELPADQRLVVVTFDDAFSSVLTSAVPDLQARGIPFTVFVPSAFMGRQPTWAIGGTDPGRIMGESDVALLSVQRLSLVGSHGASHIALRDAPNAVVLREMGESKAALEAVTDRKVELFSFPFGSFRQEHARSGADLGYKRLFTSMPSVCRSTKDAFMVGRVQVEPTDWAMEFGLKIRGAWRWMATIRLVTFTLSEKLRQIGRRKDEAGGGIRSPVQGASEGE